MDIETKEEVLKLFYSTNDNSDAAIAKKLGLRRASVAHVIQDHWNKKIARINKRVNKRYDNTEI